jgi:hypothetical protein
VSGDVLLRLKQAVAAWQDPAVRHERAVGRARDAVRRRITVAAALTGATAILLPYGGGVGWVDAGWAAAAAATAASAVLAARRLAELREYVPPPPLPRRASAARPAVDRLARGVAALRALLTGLGPEAEGIAAEATAGERSLRELAARVDAMDAALAVTPVDAHPGLREATAMLLARLDEGTLAYERLVAAAAECAAAAAGGPGDTFAHRRLEEAIDRLHGLAAGLHEARDAGRTAGLSRS